MLNWAELEREVLLGRQVLSRRRHVEEEKWENGGESSKEPCRVQRSYGYHFLVGGNRLQGSEVTYLRSHSS